MGRSSIDAEKILICYNGTPCGSEKRVVFGELGGYGLPRPRPDAVGYVNYRGAIATVRLNADGALFLESTEPPIPGGPLRRREW
jgi:hypothetical protein